MKSFSTLSGGVLIGILTIGVILSAGCITSKTTPTSSQPAFDTSATTAPVTQPPAPAQNTPNVPCRSGLTNCNGFCRDVSTDISNCGSCGIVCPGNSVCIAGTCQCKDGYSSCNGVCKDISSDAKNCGACGAVCPSGLICIKGTCGVTCTGGKTSCGAVCADLKSDTKNCGACGVTCPSGQVCNDGQCGISCINNLKYCNGYCRDLSADTANCGACGVLCPSGSTCQSGVCTLVPTAAPVPSWPGRWTIYTPGASEMDLMQNLNTGEVTGQYSGGKGLILNGKTSGNPPVLTGTWTWKPDGATGPFVFTMSAAGKSFSGLYAYSGQSPNLVWTGQRVW